MKVKWTLELTEAGTNKTVVMEFPTKRALNEIAAKLRVSGKYTRVEEIRRI